MARLMYNVAYRYHDLAYIESADITRIRFWNFGHEALLNAEMREREENLRRLQRGQ